MSKNSSSLETSKDSKRQISTERNSKAGKVAKLIVEDGAEEEELTQAQTKTLTKEVVALSTPEGQLQDLMSQAGEESVQAMIAGPVLSKLKLSIASLAGQRTFIELSVENKRGDVAGILKDLKEAKSEAAGSAKIMRAQLCVARALVVPAVAAPDPSLKNEKPG